MGIEQRRCSQPRVPIGRRGERQGDGGGLGSHTSIDAFQGTVILALGSGFWALGFGPRASLRRRRDTGPQKQKCTCHAERDASEMQVTPLNDQGAAPRAGFREVRLEQFGIDRPNDGERPWPGPDDRDRASQPPPVRGLPPGDETERTSDKRQRRLQRGAVSGMRAWNSASSARSSNARRAGCSHAMTYTAEPANIAAATRASWPESVIGRDCASSAPAFQADLESGPAVTGGPLSASRVEPTRSQSIDRQEILTSSPSVADTGALRRKVFMSPTYLGVLSRCVRRWRYIRALRTRLDAEPRLSFVRRAVRDGSSALASGDSPSGGAPPPHRARRRSEQA